MRRTMSAGSPVRWALKTSHMRRWRPLQRATLAVYCKLDHSSYWQPHLRSSSQLKLQLNCRPGQVDRSNRTSFDQSSFTFHMPGKSSRQRYFHRLEDYSAAGWQLRVLRERYLCFGCDKRFCLHLLMTIQYRILHLMENVLQKNLCPVNMGLIIL